MHLARVVADLRDDEIRPRFDLFDQLVVLAMEFALPLLERGDGDAGEEVRRRQRLGLAEGVELKALVHVIDQLQDVHRINVEDRAGAPAETQVRGVVPGQHQHVADAPGGQAEEHRFHLVAVLVPAGDVDQRFDAGFLDLVAQQFGVDRRVAAGVIGDADGVDNAAAGGHLGAVDDLFLGNLEGAAARHLLPGDGELIWVKE